jgi:hypothetical protein
MSKDVMTVLTKNYIDLSDLANFLRSDWRKQFNLDGHHMQLVEEVVFLCANDDFIRDVENIRKQILKKYPKLNIPTSNHRQAERILGFIYEHLYKPYKKSIEKLIEKYKLLPHLYWRDKFFMLDSKIEDEITDAKDYYDEKITKKEARFRAIKKITDDIDLELLDSIIIRNKPFDRYDGYPFWINPYLTRKTNELTGITINLEKEGIPYLEIGFPPYATLPEMQKLLKNNYNKIQEYRERYLSVPAKRDHRKDNLPKMIDAYLLDTQGKKKATIANILDEKYGSSITFEGVTQLVKRMKTEANRFSHNKQET